MVEPALMPFCRLVELHTGIHLDASKQYLMESRLAPLAQQQGQTVPGLLHILIRTPVGPLRHAQGRIVSCLDGGYQLDALARSVEAHVRVLAGV